MSQEQWTVLGLLIFLAGLEVVRSPNVKSFFLTVWQNFQANLSAGAQPPASATPPGGTPPGKGTVTPAPTAFPTTKAKNGI